MTALPSRDGQVGRGRTFVLAAACGLTVSNVYFSQALLADIAVAFGVAQSDAGRITALAQVGYALGILFVVPLGDMLRGKPLVASLLIGTAAALSLGALSPSITYLGWASLAVAALTVVPQVIIPAAVSAASPGDGGRVLAAVQTGLIAGIVLSRSVAGMVAAQVGSWRATYWLAAGLMLVLLFVVPRAMPERPRAAEIGYGRLLASMPLLFAREPALRLSCWLGATTFGAFCAVWATLAFYLAGPPFHLDVAGIGLFGLWGAPGAFAAPLIGRVVDRSGPERATAIALAAMAAAVLFIAAPTSTSWALIAGLNLLNFGLQAGQIANQARIFSLAAEIRSRLNTLYMVATFGTGAAASFAAALAWSRGGWPGVSALTGGLVATAALGFVLARPWRRQSRRPAPAAAE